eukprot:scaffold185671_cov21-Tisochrysis_lutea.AAC.5
MHACHVSCLCNMCPNTQTFPYAMCPAYAIHTLLAHASLSQQAAQEPYAADDEAGYLPPGLATPPGASEQTMPLLMPGQPAAASVTEPIGISSSFK